MCRWFDKRAVAAAFLLVWSCERPRRQPAAEDSTLPVPALQSQISPGHALTPATAPDRHMANAYDISEGKRLYAWFNCVGCHAHGGGGMGPPLMDALWIYGASPENIYSAIVEGRPNGMPSFRGKIPEVQIWQLVAYVRSLAGLAPKSASSGRDDQMYVRRPENLRGPEGPTAEPVVHQ